jgi:hypothetical protein
LHTCRRSIPFSIIWSREALRCADFLARVEAAGRALIDERLLLADDLAPILERAGQHWDLLAAGN